jgi:hypothetical protein
VGMEEGEIIISALVKSYHDYLSGI